MTCVSLETLLLHPCKSNESNESQLVPCLCLHFFNKYWFFFSVSMIYPLWSSVRNCWWLWKFSAMTDAANCHWIELWLWFITSQLKIVNVINLFHWSTENISLYEFMFFHLLCCAAYYLVFTTNINYLFSAYVPTSMCLHRLNLPSNQMLFYCLKMKKFNCSNLNLNTIVSFFWHSVK